MSAQKEEIILEFTVEQGQAITEMEKTKRLIISTKEEQKKLQAEYKKGNVTLDEYAKEQVRLEAILKKQQSTYLNVQKSVTGVKTQMDKLIDSNKQAATSFEKSASKMDQMSSSFKGGIQNINVYGTSIGDLTTRFTALANPVTAAIAAAGFLAAAYARSTVGAKDLAFAQSQLGHATTLVTNRFAELVSSGEDGEGLLTKFLNHSDKLAGVIGGPLGFALQPFVKDLLEESKALALIDEKFEDLARTEIDVRTQMSDRLEENAHLLSVIADEQTSYNDKLIFSREIEQNLITNKKEITGILEQQLDLVNQQLEKDQFNERLLTKQKELQREIQKEQTGIERKLQAQFRATENLVEAEEKRLATVRAANAADSRAIARANSGSAIGEVADPRINEEHNRALAIIGINERMNRDIEKMNKEHQDQQAEIAAEGVKRQIAIEQAKIGAAADIAGALVGIAEQGSEAQRALALFAIGLDTAEAIAHLTEKSEENPFNSVTFGAAGIAQFAAGLARIIGNIAMAKNYIEGFAEGGYTGPGGKHEPAGLVHKGEVVFSQRDVNMLGGPAIVNRMRPTYPSTSALTGGYYDGGLVTGAANIDASLASANAIKNMPVPEVSVKEISKVANRVKVKENSSRLKPTKR